MAPILVSFDLWLERGAIITADYTLYTVTHRSLPLTLHIHRVLVPGPPRIPKSADAQVPDIKWCSKMNTVGPLCPWVWHLRIRSLVV